MAEFIVGGTSWYRPSAWRPPTSAEGWAKETAGAMHGSDQQEELILRALRSYGAQCREEERNRIRSELHQSLQGCRWCGTKIIAQPVEEGGVFRLELVCEQCTRSAAQSGEPEKLRALGLTQGNA